MFNEIYILAGENEYTFSLYVDDMTFSANKPISRQFRNEVALILKKYGLIAKEKKDHFYDKKSLAITTGVGIKEGRLVVLNSKRKAIIDQYKLCKEKDEIREIEKLNGMLCAVRQIEPEIFPSIYAYVKYNENRLKEYSKKRRKKWKQIKGKIIEPKLSL